MKLLAWLLSIGLAICFTVVLTKKVNDRTDTANRAQQAGVKNGQQAVAGQNLGKLVQSQCAEGGAVARQLGPLCFQASKVAAASPSPVPGVTSTVIPGAQGIQGVQGVQGVSGVQGPRGVSGSSGASGKPGSNGAQGASGASGAPGVPGSPGPSGASGEPGVTGPAGPAGPSGATGQSGAAGADGQPPQSFTFTYVDSLGVTRTETCERNTPFDASEPQYTCVVTS